MKSEKYSTLQTKQQKYLYVGSMRKLCIKNIQDSFT